MACKRTSLTHGRVSGRHRARSFRAALGAALACLVVAGLSPAASAAPGFALSGTVVDEHGRPLSSICVTTEEGSTPTGTALTDLDGNYTVPVGPGSHDVRFTDCRTFPTHVTQWWKGRSTERDADTVSVTDHDVTLGTITLRPGVAVTGTVRDSRGTGQADTHVTVSSVDGAISSSALSGPDGTYRTGPLPDGAYHVRFDGPASSGQPVQYWKGTWTRSAAAALDLSASAGSEHPEVDASMVEGAVIDGVVTDDAGTPLAGICVGAYQRTDGSAGDGLGAATTAPDGSYSLTNLPPVETLVQFSDCNGTGYVSEWYSEATRSTDAKVAYLEPGARLFGVDARLTRGASISGRVTDTDGTPLDQICVSAVREDGDEDTGKPMTRATTDADGTYRLGGLGAEPVVVGFHDCNEVGPYLEQWFDGVDAPGDATTITLLPGEEHAGVDARLVRAGTISGRVTD
ncbi:MAG: carboxypeptidase-like regulatory domain-containing protein, partial [Actinomycetota bacterium]|nr:carboxypeptidase-like regulatory domain-containing protein [Actinomycetota bacterium]